MPEIKITTDFIKLEAALARLERSTVDYWATVFAEYSAVSEGVDVKTFANAWQAKVKTRSASSVAQNVGHIKWVFDNGYDLSSFVSMAHIIEVKSAKKSAPSAAKKFDALKRAQQVGKGLTKRQREALAHALLALD